MLASMTAFSRQSSQNEWGALIWELRTVNHRYLDISIRVPDILRSLEPLFREHLSKQLHRGKVEATLRWLPEQDTISRFHLNQSAIKQLATLSQHVRQYFPETQIDLFKILEWPGVLETVEKAQEEVMHKAALALLQTTITDLVQMRRQEGARLKSFIQEHLEAISGMITQITDQIPLLVAAERERINQRVAELKVEVDIPRMEQEIALLIHRTDITEEIQRLASHCEAMQSALSQSGAVGRRLDFLSQELHREANTLSSKAIAVSLIRASVDLKVWIEQIREQVQNIE
jgi:uncharacterized protein (TIGR00255 family)